jgi:hypothetical protein
VTVRTPSQLPPVRLGQEQLDAVLVAIVESALLRTPPGARVLASADVISDRHGSTIGVRVRVADRGPDLAGEAKYWMLVRLRGTGPLATAVSGLATAGNCRLTIEDNPAGGIVFNLTLPAAAHR